MTGFSHLFNNAAMARVLDYLIDRATEEEDFIITKTETSKGAEISYRTSHAIFEKLIEIGILEEVGVLRGKDHLYKLAISPLLTTTIRFKSQLIQTALASPVGRGKIASR